MLARLLLVLLWAGPVSASSLSVMDGRSLIALSFGKQIAFQSLQGIVNQSDPPRIFLAVRVAEPNDDQWLDLLRRKYLLDHIEQDDFTSYLTLFRSSLSGYVLFDSRTPASINVALSLSGVLRAIAIDAADDDLLQKVTALGLVQLDDVRLRDWQWLRQSDYWSRLDEDGIVQLNPLAAPSLRDYGVSRGMAFFSMTHRKTRPYPS